MVFFYSMSKVSHKLNRDLQLHSPLGINTIKMIIETQLLGCNFSRFFRTDRTIGRPRIGCEFSGGLEVVLHLTSPRK